MPRSNVVFPLQPVSSAKIDTVFCDSNYPKAWGLHTGWDINGTEGGDNDQGREFVCMADGEVVYVSDNAGASWGGLIVVWHPGFGVWSRYGHHQPGSCRVRVGQEIGAGDVLGRIGKGHRGAFLAHIHFDILTVKPVFRNGSPHWSHWPMSNLYELRRIYLDPTLLFNKFKVPTPPIPNSRRMYLDG
jgi:murein DD-endopeptidase MepM/ murein hydrolase activator NlpD